MNTVVISVPSCKQVSDIRGCDWAKSDLEVRADYELVDNKLYKEIEMQEIFKFLCEND